MKHVVSSCHWKPTGTRVSPIQSRREAGQCVKWRRCATVSHALQSDLPKGMLRHPEWLQVGMLLVQASESGAKRDVRIATDQLVQLIEKQGWMDRPRLAR